MKPPARFARLSSNLSLPLNETKGSANSQSSSSAWDGRRRETALSRSTARSSLKCHFHAGSLTAARVHPAREEVGLALVVGLDSLHGFGHGARRRRGRAPLHWTAQRRLGFPS